MKSFTIFSMLKHVRSKALQILLAMMFSTGWNITYAQPCLPEVCNSIDDDCDGLIDEGVQTTFWIDMDGDGAYNPNSILLCTTPYGPSWVASPTNPGSCPDANDADNLILCAEEVLFEVCNGIDDDGNGLIDADDPGLVNAIYWYADSDGDGYGDANSSIYSCTQLAGYVPYPNNIDCDDTNPAVAMDCNSIDTDCDGVPDNLDVCPGGDDSKDLNQDGIADCSQLLIYNEYSPTWRCGNYKIYVCHNENNPQTICIDASALNTHYNHGDKIGPCSSCQQNLVIPGIPTQDAASFHFRTKYMDPDMHDSAEPLSTFILSSHSDELFLVLPNPADDHIEVQTSFSPAVISLLDVCGKIVFKNMVSAQKNTITTQSLLGGIYFIRLETKAGCFTKTLVVVHN